MPSYVALLRALNVAGREASMGALRARLSEVGFGDVATHGKDGNVRLSTRMRKSERVAAAIEESLTGLLGFPVEAMVRGVEDFAGIHRYGASLECPAGGPVRRYVAFLRDPAPPEVVRIAASWDVPGERVVPHGRELHLCLREPLRSAATPVRLEASAGALTIRSAKVVRELFERWAADPS